MVKVVVAPRARAQIRAAVERWEHEHARGSSRLAEEIARALELLASFPELGLSVGRRGRRRLLLPDVGYHIYYTRNATRVEVSAVWHAHRRGVPR